MMVYILTVYLILVASHHYVKSDSMCISNTITGRHVTLSGYNNDTGPCECQITLKRVFNSDSFASRKITITKTHFPVNCYYKLSYWLHHTAIEESKHESDTFEMEINSILYVRMENQVIIGSGDLCFQFTITTLSSAYEVVASCENKNTSPTMKTTTTAPTTRAPTTRASTTRAPTTRTPTTRTPTTRASTTRAPTTRTPTTRTPTTRAPTTRAPTTTIPYPGTSVVSQTDDNVSRGEIGQTLSSTIIVSKIQATKEKIDNNNTDDENSLLPIILGCSVGGTVVITLVIVIVGCVSFRRRQTTTHSNTENNTHGEMIINDNDLYISSDSIPMNNNQQSTNNMAEMEIIPNDLYQSSDSLADDLNDSSQHEHVPGQIEHVPNTYAEYAVVKKRPKKISNTDTAIELNTSPNKVNANYDNVQIEQDNLKIEIDRIVGPKGDEYTLVNIY